MDAMGSDVGHVRTYTDATRKDRDASGLVAIVDAGLLVLLLSSALQRPGG